MPNNPDHRCAHTNTHIREDAVRAYGPIANRLPAHITRDQIIEAIEVLGLPADATLTIQSEQLHVTLIDQQADGSRPPSPLGTGYAKTAIYYDIWPSTPPCQKEEKTQ